MGHGCSWVLLCQIASPHVFKTAKRNYLTAKRKLLVLSL